MPKEKSFSFFRLFANLLIAASTFSLAYTVWAIYDNIRSQAQSASLETQSAPAHSVDSTKR